MRSNIQTIVFVTNQILLKKCFRYFNSYFLIAAAGIEYLDAVSLQLALSWSAALQNSSSTCLNCFPSIKI